MTVPVEVCLKGEDYASNESISGIPREPKSWTDADVRLVLEGMLQALHRKKHPSSPDQPVALRGFSWIVNPFETGGVVIALEMTVGAVVAGPFDVSESALSGLIERAMAADRTAMAGQSRTIH